MGEEHNSTGADVDEKSESRYKRRKKLKKSRFYIPRHQKYLIPYAHAGVINGLRWSRPWGQTLASFSADKTIKIWDLLRNFPDTCSFEPLVTLSHHSESVQDVCWQNQGLLLASCGLDARLVITDMNTGQIILRSENESMLECVKWHPQEPSLLLFGGFQSLLATLDTRSNQIVRTFKGLSGRVHDVEWIDHTGSLFLASTDYTQRNAAHRSLAVFDFATGAIVSDQMYMEMYPCVRLKRHPHGQQILAQTQGDYVAVFSTSTPFRFNKNKKFEGHQVRGYRIGLDITLDGKFVASGSVDGSVHFFNYFNNEHHSLPAFSSVCTDVCFHPLLPSVCGASSSTGAISLFH
eukprot:TRINITY_DN10415_c0_g1_i2.p1 TRINITY_DN10415_c0_g1~~TRINITY_DN10415_c0_g1_i2.p1  ORF type:complete len:396 (-),score=41.56 TRINITY_DN10415_c0_g1_i2:33-1079(-)